MESQDGRAVWFLWITSMCDGVRKEADKERHARRVGGV